MAINRQLEPRLTAENVHHEEFEVLSAILNDSDCSVTYEEAVAIGEDLLDFFDALSEVEDIHDA